MLFKGIVMEVKDKYSIIMKEDSSLIRIKNKEGMRKGDTIFFTDEDIYIKKKKEINKVIPLFVSIAAIFMFVLLPTVGNKDEGYAKLSIDINPSIQMILDDEMNIIDVEQLNEESEHIQTKDIETKSLDYGLSKLKEELIKLGYNLEDDTAIVGFGFIDEESNKDYEDEIKKIVDETFDKTNILYIKVTNEELEGIDEDDESIGRSKLNKQISEDTSDMTVEEIIKSLKEEDKHDYLDEIDSDDDIYEDYLDEIDDDEEDDNIDSKEDDDSDREYEDSDIDEEDEIEEDDYQEEDSNEEYESDDDLEQDNEENEEQDDKEEEDNESDEYNDDNDDSDDEEDDERELDKEDDEENEIEED